MEPWTWIWVNLKKKKCDTRFASLNANSCAALLSYGHSVFWLYFAQPDLARAGARRIVPALPRWGWRRVELDLALSPSAPPGLGEGTAAYVQAQVCAQCPELCLPAGLWVVSPRPRGQCQPVGPGPACVPPQHPEELIWCKCWRFWFSGPGQNSRNLYFGKHPQRFWWGVGRFGSHWSRPSSYQFRLPSCPSPLPIARPSLVWTFSATRSSLLHRLVWSAILIAKKFFLTLSQRLASHCHSRPTFPVQGQAALPSPAPLPLLSLHLRASARNLLTQRTPTENCHWCLFSGWQPVLSLSPQRAWSGEEAEMLPSPCADTALREAAEVEKPVKQKDVQSRPSLTQTGA